MRIAGLLYATLMVISSSPLRGQALHARKSPCDLINAKVAARLLGTTVKAGQDLGAMCTFTHDDKHDVTIGVIDAKGKGAGAAFRSAVEQDKDKKSEAVPGVGELAAYLKSATESDFHVLFHGKIISLGVRGAKNANLKPEMVQTVKDLLPGF